MARITTPAVAEAPVVCNQARLQHIIDTAISDSKTDVEIQDFDDVIVVLTYANDFNTTTILDTNLEIKEFFVDDDGIEYDPYENILSQVSINFEVLKKDLNETMGV